MYGLTPKTLPVMSVDNFLDDALLNTSTLIIHILHRWIMPIFGHNSGNMVGSVKLLCSVAISKIQLFILGLKVIMFSLLGQESEFEGG
jgi:hypothetical protein